MNICIREKIILNLSELNMIFPIEVLYLYGCPGMGADPTHSTV